jgi:hypothetical protein
VTCPQLVDSGVYVLGALPPAQRLTYERHLVTCAECRAEVGDLAVLPGLLGRLDEPSVTAVTDNDQVPPSVLTGALWRVRRQRRTRRFAAGLVAAGVACVALIAGIALPNGAEQLASPRPSVPVTTAPPTGSAPPTSTSPTPSGPTQLEQHKMTPVGSPGSVTANVAFRSLSTGTEVDLTCWYGSTSEAAHYHGGSASFSLFVIPRGGGKAAWLRSWTARPGDMARLPAVSPWPLSKFDRIELRNSAGKTLLVYSPA